MANREISTGRKRNGHPQDWCVDESWVAWQLFKALGDFRQEREAGEAIWDPCAGSGRTLSTFVENGFTAFAGDIVAARDYWPQMPCSSASCVSAQSLAKSSSVSSSGS